MPTITHCDSFKRFLDETADNLGNLKRKEVEELYENLVETILEQDSAEIIEEVLAFCSASVLEMIQSAKRSLLKIFEQRETLKCYSNFHVLVSSVVSTIVQNQNSDFEAEWVDSLLESVISGLTAIESDTISLSGSSLIKLLQWNCESNERLSKRLADHPDFVVILIADMCAMFSRIEEVDSAPFLRIVRFCELLIDVSDKKSGLMNKIVETVEKEFISKVYRTTLKTMTSGNLALKWSNELLKVCHRGNELVKPLVGEVFKEIKCENFIENMDLIGILANERSRTIPEIVQLLFTTDNTNLEPVLMTNETESDLVINDELYKKVLLDRLDSFERFKICDFHKFKSITPVGVLLFQCHRTVLLNWLPYIMKVAEIEKGDNELGLHMEISRKLIEYLDL